MSYVLPQSASGSITVTPSALHALVARAGDSVDGVQVRRGRRRLEVGLSDGHVRVRLELAVRYGSVLSAVAYAVQEKVAAALVTMCAVEVGGIDVFVEEVE
ncbi:MAG: Asp23/Gls24 family envelope stress response protein [Actinobacteria bacterium]|nr:Asp23/Gls24 family envelope stress response protein [Actinomycetota bacterium]